MSGGYTTSTDAMVTASRTIVQLAEDLPDKNTDLASSPVTKEGFGQAHGDKADKYISGAKALWDSVSGYSNVLKAFGTNLGIGNNAYADIDDTHRSTISKAGSQ